MSFLRELERENQALELELKAIQDSYVEKAQKSYTNMMQQQALAPSSTNNCSSKESSLAIDAMASSSDL